MSQPIQGLSTAPLAGAAPAAAATVDPKVREAAEQFEGVFMSMLVGEMMKGTQPEGSNAIYTGLMTEKLGDELARSGGIGLADVLETQLGGVR
ncbi:MAG TPA: rod-binding protein [Miltoncostaeaceae bacterium]|nr:rod-binding protein [Miltoncostaeaceae bacterium]